jgi:uncharacterized membrane protein YgdD (TMEM256/DUF423 family)
MKGWSALLACLGGCAGAAGIGLSAYATHAGAGPNLTLSAQFLLFHAGVLVLIGTLAPFRLCILASASVLALGVALFSGDLALRALQGHALAPMAAPTGGMLMIAGWLALGIAGAFTAWRRSA